MSSVVDCDYQFFKECNCEYAQLRYILQHSQQERLSVPSSVFVDIAGFRFNIVSALPIQQNQRYSNQTNPHPLVKKLMPSLQEKAKYEVWHGEDNRDYMICCSDLLPSDPFAGNGSTSSQTVRPEVADVLSGKNGDEGVEALTALYQNVVHELEMMEDPPCNSPELTAFLHRRGVSIRHIGILYQMVNAPWLANLLFIEMIARTAKCLLWKNQRCVVYERIPELENLSSVEELMNAFEKIKQYLMDNVLAFLNTIFCANPESQDYWSNTLLPLLCNKFTGITALPSYEINSWELFHSVCYHCGLTINYTGNETLMQDTPPFTSEVICDIPYRMKLLLPPSLKTDPEWMFVEGLVNKSSGYINDVLIANNCLDSAIQILTTLNSPLLPSAYLTQAQLYQQRKNYNASYDIAIQAASSCHPYDSVYMRCLGIFFLAGQDPYQIIEDINDYFTVFTSHFAYYLPWVIFTVGMYCYMKDPSLAMEYINQGKILCVETVGKENPQYASILSFLGDVGIVILS